MNNNNRFWSRELQETPYDKVFDVDGSEELCHATGLEINFSDPEDSTEWWNEYIDRNGEFHYGR